MEVHPLRLSCCNCSTICFSASFSTKSNLNWNPTKGKEDDFGYVNKNKWEKIGSRAPFILVHGCITVRLALVESDG